MLRKLLVGTLCTLSLLACGKTVDGLLTNSSVLTFNMKKNKTASVPAGRWETQIKFPSKKEVKLEIKSATGETEVSFKVPKSAPLPTENGDFELLSTLSGQPYDVKGSVKTTHVDSDERWEWESCTYQVQREECYFNGHHHVCRWVNYNVQGSRNVRYFIRQTTQDVTFNLLTASRTLGAFAGTERSTERVYTQTGMCR